MLKQIKISSLFGLYDYNLDFTDNEDNYLTIITGPNGYGKTTILQMINALFRKDIATFLRIPFSVEEFLFDEDVIKVSQRREIAEVDEESDLPADEKVHIVFEQVNPETKNVVYAKEFSSSDTTMEIHGQLELLLNSFKCYFLTDERILLRKTEQGELEHKASSNDSMDNMAKAIAEIFSRNENIRGINLFRELVSFFNFTDKEMILDGTFGIRFRMNNASKTIIPITAISSGEKHLLLQLFELIFRGVSGDLVMIDEPELSFHPAWLNEYVNVLERIQDFKKEEGKEMQIILATHSPILIGERWNKTLELYTLRNNSEY